MLKWARSPIQLPSAFAGCNSLELAVQDARELTQAAQMTAAGFVMQVGWKGMVL